MGTFRNTHHLCLMLNASDSALKAWVLQEVYKTRQEGWGGNAYGQSYVTIQSVMRGCLEEVGYKDLVRK